MFNKGTDDDMKHSKPEDAQKIKFKHKTKKY